MGSKRSYFTCKFFIFLEESFALPLMQLLLLIVSKRLDNLLSVCGAQGFIFCFGLAGLVFTGNMSSDLLSTPSLCCTFQSLPQSFSSMPYASLFFICFCLIDFLFAFTLKMLKLSDFYMFLLDFVSTCHFCFI